MRAPPQPQQQQQVQKTVNAHSYPNTLGQVKKVSPKREIPVQKVAPMQKVSPMPPPPTPPEMLLENEEEVTTSENRPIETVRGETKVIVTLPSGLKKEVTINENFPLTLNDFLKAIDYPMPANATNMTAEEITDGVGESEQDDMENNEVRRENSENPGQLSKEDELQNDIKVGISDEDKTPHSNTELPKFPLDELFLKSRKTIADSLSDDSPKKKRVCRKKRAEEPRMCLRRKY